MLHVWLAKMYYSPRLSSTARLRRIWERKINNKIILSLMWQPDFCGWAGKSLSIAGQPGGFGSWDSHISFCTHHTQTFECGGGGKRATIQKALYRSFGMCVLHFKWEPEPVFGPSLAFRTHFMELSLQGLLLNVRIRNLHHCWSLSQRMSWMGWPRTLLQPCLPWQVCLKSTKSFPSLSPPKTLWPVSSRKGGMFAEQCRFLLLKYRWKLNLAPNSLKWS